MRCLILTLEAPAMSFGRAAIDGAGSTGRLPGLSMITGLVANAMGLERRDADALDALQADLLFAARVDREGIVMRDFQTVRLQKDDKGWTRFGPEGRGGNSYDNPDIRQMPYLADHAVSIALASSGRRFGIEEIETALARPLRPVFIGRKAFMPVRPVIDGRRAVRAEAENVLEALRQVPVLEPGKTECLACWPAEIEGGRSIEVSDQKNWASNFHGGFRKMKEGRISVAAQ